MKNQSILEASRLEGCDILWQNVQSNCWYDTLEGRPYAIEQAVLIILFVEKHCIGVLDD